MRMGSKCMIVRILVLMFAAVLSMQAMDDSKNGRDASPTQDNEHQIRVEEESKERADVADAAPVAELSELDARFLHAIESGNYRVMRKMMRDGQVDLYAEDSDGKTPLITAVCCGNEDMAVALLDSNVDVNRPNKKSGVTPLMVAADEGKGVLASLLLRKKANIEAGDGEGSTALMCAAVQGHVFLVD